MTVCVEDICQVMEAIAPARLAESWDNVGLQVGHRRWPVATVMVALDPLTAVVAAACRAGAGLLVTHHPLIFKPLQRLDLETPLGAIIAMALEHRLAIFSAHTNLDSAADGLNDLLARRIGLTLEGALSPLDVPSAGSLERASREGLGRVGLLPAAMTLEALARQVQTRIPAARVRFAGERDLLVKRVALCSGSGGSLLEVFAGSGCEAFISGDLRYHDARWAEENGRGLIDIGHFASEHLVVADLAQRLQAGLQQRGLRVVVTAFGDEIEPFKNL
ncbi:MAG TPA: Nif3-like dinuclear metal center hexameric protein [Desulfobacterales bacterium]|nr:Nif3-like dinuclear metal center hexameric protein [Desulfobacterales bacterium]